MDQLLILPSQDGALVFGMDWLPLIGRRAERAAYRIARQHKATHLALEGPGAAAVGLAAVPPARAHRGKTLHSAAQGMAGLFPTGTVAMLIQVQPGAFWVVAIHEGAVIAGTDRLYDASARARAALADLKQAFPHLRVLGDGQAPDAPDLQAIRGAGTAQSRLLRVGARRPMLPAPLQWFGLALVLVLLAPRLWALATGWGPGRPEAAERPDPVAAWRQAMLATARTHVVHGIAGTRQVLEALYELPVQVAGWSLAGAQCLADGRTWRCQADYRRTAPDASNDSFLGGVPGHWRVGFASMDLARPGWEFPSGATGLDRHVPDSVGHNDRYLLSRLQAISPAFTQLQLGKSAALAVASPRDGHGVEIPRPAQVPRYFRRAVRIKGPLRSASLLPPHAASMRWEKIGIVLGDARQATLKTSRIMISFEGALYEVESSHRTHHDQPADSVSARSATGPRAVSKPS